MITLATDRTTQYARDVASGRIVAGEFVRLAAARHLRDIKEGGKRGLKWDCAAADRAIDFFPAVLSITEGAMVGQPFKLLPWHLFTVGSIYGWKDKDGNRRFRFVWLETGKGQAKSPLMAGLGIYEITGRGSKRAECYAIGEDRKTANVMFRDAAAMCRAEIPGKPGVTLESSGRIMVRGFGDNAWKLEHPASGSKFEPVANSDAISGPKPTLVLGDEIHEMKTNKAISIWRAAIAKMSGDPMMVLGTNTPSVDQHVGTQYSEYFQKVLRHEFTDDSAFGYIARTDKGDDPFNDESCWIKSLPALGITYPVENIRKEVQTAKGMISTALTTKRLSRRATQADKITAVIAPGVFVQGVAGFEISANSVTVTMEVAAVEIYARTVPMQDESVVIDWFSYFTEPIAQLTEFVLTDLPAYGDAEITITVTLTGGIVSVGQFVVGPIWNVGITKIGGTGFSGIDFSFVEQDEFGDLTTVQHAATRLSTFDVLMRNSSLLAFETRMRSLRGGTAAVWIGDAGASKAAVNYGFYRGYRNAYETNDYSIISIEVQGIV